MDAPMAEGSQESHKRKVYRPVFEESYNTTFYNPLGRMFRTLRNVFLLWVHEEGIGYTTM